MFSREARLASERRTGEG